VISTFCKGHNSEAQYWAANMTDLLTLDSKFESPCQRKEVESSNAGILIF
jgi:hypothetical protein